MQTVKTQISMSIARRPCAFFLCLEKSQIKHTLIVLNGTTLYSPNLMSITMYVFMGK